MRCMITDNVEVIVGKSLFGCTVTISGGYAGVAAVGWAYVIADRLQKRGIDCQVKGGDGEPPWATITVNGRGMYQTVGECIGEVR